MRTIQILLVCVTLWPSTAVAETISWVDFSSYPTGAISQNGLESVSGLELDASFSTLANVQSGFPIANMHTIADPNWPYDNADVPALGVISKDNAILTTDLTFNFVNGNGLPAGASVAIVDLENSSASVTLTGYRNGFVVPVDWSISFHETAGASVLPPDWNANTNTLTGSGDFQNFTSNLALLVNDVQLDRLVFEIVGVPDDGISFAVAADPTQAPATVPEPSSLLLWGTAAVVLLIVCNYRGGFSSAT